MVKAAAFRVAQKTFSQSDACNSPWLQWAARLTGVLNHLPNFLCKQYHKVKPCCYYISCTTWQYVLLGKSAQYEIARRKYMKNCRKEVTALRCTSYEWRRYWYEVITSKRCSSVVIFFGCTPSPQHQEPWTGFRCDSALSLVVLSLTVRPVFLSIRPLV